jgi:His-Xaa-Ser system radical SAM maturase HxsC
MNKINLFTQFDDNISHLHLSNNSILKVTTNYNIPEARRGNFALIIDETNKNLPKNFALGISFFNTTHENVINIDPSLEYLSDGDVIKINIKDKRLKVMYRASSRFNFFLLTERCNHYCLMCSQPPKNIQDDWHYEDINQTIEMIDRGSPFIGITGGEPTLLGDRFIQLLRKINGRLPETPLLVLTNGRKFNDIDFVNKIANINHQDLTFAIPIYSDNPPIHDYVVQSAGAFEETIRGILRLKERGQKVQIRIVIHKQTYQRLPQLAEYIYRNLAFVDHIALMGLEITGFTKANLEELWIDPIKYSDELECATLYLSRMGMNVSIFNHQLCTIPKSIWSFSVKSISDWKNYFLKECDHCSMINDCGGFFTTSGDKISANIKAI